ncbi:hypothetical protein BB561_004931 [Smittium simulii]|uniref:Uncharacterized protein n=1 Tax=Smittium simulii TaxID=133385 RepID=A0A2T9YDD1_9FUNG|nr:hypothetical protein BB561_004931 [Smittium simulii]
MFARNLIKSRAIFALSKPAQSARFFGSSFFARESHPETKIVQGKGATPGYIPTDVEQATGLDRLEQLAALNGEEFFDMKPLVLHTKGTRTNPTIVRSGAPWRLVGCQGAPSESHELIWIRVERSHGIDRCPECGNVYKLSE